MAIHVRLFFALLLTSLGLVEHLMFLKEVSYAHNGSIYLNNLFAHFDWYSEHVKKQL